MPLAEILLWLGRIVTVLPALAELWQAVDDKDDKAQLEAALALVRAIKDREAREEIGG